MIKNNEDNKKRRQKTEKKRKKHVESVNKVTVRDHERDSFVQRSFKQTIEKREVGKKKTQRSGDGRRRKVAE